MIILPYRNHLVMKELMEGYWRKMYIEMSGTFTIQSANCDDEVLLNLLLLHIYKQISNQSVNIIIHCRVLMLYEYNKFVLLNSRIEMQPYLYQFMNIQ